MDLISKPRGDTVGFTVHATRPSRESGNPEKKYKYRKFLKLKARFISLYAGFLLSQE
ncbi:MAG TPA: hypothetical protein LFV92_01560 [Rickettsia endosymbiont of Ceroptres masudai]|nr:hypothetical protein [Rickettsia endosymbiont of Ceroptres masudai]